MKLIWELCDHFDRETENKVFWSFSNRIASLSKCHYIRLGFQRSFACMYTIINISTISNGNNNKMRYKISKSKERRKKYHKENITSNVLLSNKQQNKKQSFRILVELYLYFGRLNHLHVWHESSTQIVCLPSAQHKNTISHKIAVIWNIIEELTIFIDYYFSIFFLIFFSFQI